EITKIFDDIEELRTATCNLAGNLKAERRSGIMKNMWRVAFGVGGICMAGANTAFAPILTPLFAGFSIIVAGKIVVTTAQEILESLKAGDALKQTPVTPNQTSKPPSVVGSSPSVRA